MNRRGKFLIIAATLLVAAISSPNRAEAQRRSDDPLRHGHALLIGNYHYVDKGWPLLADIPLQLRQLKEGLKNHFDDVEIAEDLKTDDLRDRINGFIRKYGNEASARLFIYYAGHGYTEVIRNENRGYITGIDTPSIDGTTQAYNAARLKAIAMLEIRTPLQLAPAGHILFVFDSCFAGTIFTNRGDPSPRTLTPDVVNRIMEKPARDFITAGGANEPIPAHSPIPGFLLAALNGGDEADRYRLGVISAVDIARYLRSHVLNLPGSNFTPQYGRLPDPEFAEGEFLFRLPNFGNTVDRSAEAWVAVKDTTSIAILEQFLMLYPSSIYPPFANARIKELKGIEDLKKLQAAAASQPLPPALPSQPVAPEKAVIAPPIVPPKAFMQSLLAKLSTSDLERFGGFDENRTNAIAQATKSPDSRRELDDLTAVLAGNEMPMTQQQLIGEWRCRTLKLGGNLPLTIYPFFRCRIFAEGDSLIFQKTSGSQRTRGKLYRLSETVYVYVGASTVNDEVPISYGTKAEADEVAYLFRVGPNRLRLEFPKPYYESDFDIMDLRK